MLNEEIVGSILKEYTKEFKNELIEKNAFEETNIEISQILNYEVWRPVKCFRTSSSFVNKHSSTGDYIKMKLDLLQIEYLSLWYLQFNIETWNFDDTFRW